MTFLLSESKELLARARARFFTNLEAGEGRSVSGHKSTFIELCCCDEVENTGLRVGNFVINEISRWTRSRGSLMAGRPSFLPASMIDGRSLSRIYTRRSACVEKRVTCFKKLFHSPPFPTHRPALNRVW